MPEYEEALEDNTDDDNDDEDIFSQMMYEKNEEFDKVCEELNHLKGQFKQANDKIELLNNENGVLRKENIELNRENRELTARANKNGPEQEIIKSTLAGTIMLSLIK